MECSQQSAGNIIQVKRESLYVGLGANAVGGGTVNIPGLNYNLNVGEAWYGYLASRQKVVGSRRPLRPSATTCCSASASPTSNCCAARAGRRSPRRTASKPAGLARLTAAYAQTGQGRKADADRAAVDLRRRDAELTQAEGDTLAASARLAQLLNLDPSTRLRPVDGWVVPAPIVPDPIPLAELLAIALMQRPELAARQSEVRTALYELSLAKVLPFSPNAIVGFSTGGFGGGSNLVSTPPGFISGNGSRIVAPAFSSLESRTDFDVVVYWTFRNLGIGNLAMIRAADSRAKQTRLRELETLNLVRAQVAEAHGWVAAGFLQIDAGEKAVSRARMPTRRTSSAFAADKGCRSKWSTVCGSWAGRVTSISIRLSTTIGPSFSYGSRWANRRRTVWPDPCRRNWFHRRPCHSRRSSPCRPRPNRDAGLSVSIRNAAEWRDRHVGSLDNKG